MIYTKETTLSEIIFSNYDAANIFENFNLNFTTNGNNTISKACLQNGIKPSVILNELKKINTEKTYLFKISEWKIDFLCDYIESNHHTYIRKTMPKIISKFKSLLKDDNSDETLLKIFKQLNIDIEIHMQKEEKLLFPYIKKLVKKQNDREVFETAPFGTVTNIIKVMEKEHNEANKVIENIKKVCKNYKTAKQDSEIKKSLHQLLKEFESDFHIHIHIENYLLFPGAILLEKKLKNKTKKNIFKTIKR